MKANVSIGFILAGSAIFLLNMENRGRILHSIIYVFLGIIFLLGAFILSEYIFNIDSGIDELFFKEDPGAINTSHSGRASPFTALCFVFFALSLSGGYKTRTRIKLFQGLAILIIVFSFVALMGYVLDTSRLFGIPGYTFMAFHTALLFFLLGLATIFLEPERGLMQVINNSSSGSKLIRKTFTQVFFLIILIGWLQSKGLNTGLYDAETGIFLFIISVLIIVFALILYNANALTKTDLELKKSEKLLLQANRSLEAAEKLALLGSWEYNIYGEDGIWSKEIFRILGLKVSEKAPSFKEFLQLIHPDDREPVQKIFDQMVDGAEVENKTLRTNPERGEIKYLTLNWEIVKDSKGKPYKYLGSIQDISERVKTREVLKESEEKFRSVVEQSLTGVYIIKGDYFSYVNPQFAIIFGYSQEEMLDNFLAGSIVYEEDKEMVRQNVYDRLEGKKAKSNYRFRGIKKDGSVIHVEVFGVKAVQGGRPVTIGTLLDVTENKNAEEKIKSYNEQLRQLTARLQEVREEERVRVRTEIHEELGQLLAVLKIRVARLDVEKSKEPAIAELLLQLDNCLSLVRKISVDLRPGILDDLGLIEAFEWQTREFEKTTNIKTGFITNVNSLELPPAHAISLFRIFQESLTNVALHSKATVVKCILSVRNNSLDLTISDDGVVLDKVNFTPEQTLGLMGMKERAMMMKGDYNIESTSEKGTEVKISIPYLDM